MTGGADLHLHSRHSDGTDEPEQIVRLAREAGLQAISLTDHDSIGGVESAIETGKRLGLQVVPGVELSAEFLGHEVHLLAYGFDCQAPPLLKLLEDSRRERESRAARMVERLNQLGIPLTMSQVSGAAAGASLGRPHLADALLRSGVVSNFQEAFDRYLNPGRPAFVPRVQLPLESARRATVGSGGVLILAHPHLNLSSGNIQSLLDAGIDGLEYNHPKLKASQRRELAKLARDRNLLATGGSDYHGGHRGLVRVGSVTVPMEVVDRIHEIASARVRPGAGEPGEFRWSRES